MAKKEPATLDEAKEIIQKLEEDLRVERNVRVHYEQRISSKEESIRDYTRQIKEKDAQIHALHNAINYIARKVDIG
jgi:predicted RNase H-like nuclease (RuvC/YqgF family)